eukprot:852102-Pyramimonas_sp.AAC.1
MLATIQLAQQTNGGGERIRWRSQSSPRRLPCSIGACFTLGGRRDEADFGNACPFICVRFSDEAAPASDAQQDGRGKLTELVAILVHLRLLPRGAIGSFCDEPPGNSCIRTAKTWRCGYSLKRVATAQGGCLRALLTGRFPREERRRMQTEWGAASREARLKASDLAGEVWQFWLASEAAEGVAQHGAVAAGCRGKLLVHVGALRFIVDAGCGYDLIADRSIRAAGAIRMIKRSG